MTALLVALLLAQAPTQAQASPAASPAAPAVSPPPASPAPSPPALSPPPPLPFPAPRAVQVTERTKFDPGTVIGFDPVKGELRIQCVAGVVTFKVAVEVPVFDAAGQPLGSPARLAAGQKVRVWYVVDNGARALEISAQ